MDSLAKLYEPYMAICYGVCLKYLQTPDDAKDAVVNIFEELVTKVKKYEIENFGGWLYRLARNHCLMHLRSNKKYPKTVEMPVMHLGEESHLEDVMEKEQQLDRMNDCIEQLSDEQKQAVQLFYLQNKCYKEIADETGVDTGKVRSHIQNGRRNLKICMETSEEQTS